MFLTTYQRLQAIKLRLLREELRSRDATQSERMLDSAEFAWLNEDRLRFLMHDPEGADRRRPDSAINVCWPDC
jgi:hypothetical protein